MLRKVFITVCAAAAVAAFGGCKKKENVPVVQNPTPSPTPPTPTPPTPSPTPSPTPTPTPSPTGGGGNYEGMDTVADSGTVSGKVTWKGNKPTLEAFPITKDGATCGKEKPSNRLTIGGSGGVQYTLVSLVDIKKGKKLDTNAKPSLDQANCEYTPHVQVVPVGSQLTVINSDPILHNVHAYLGSATEFNMGMPIKNQKIPKQMAKPGLIELQCDAGHTWMNAHIMVAEHPYHAVTDQNGAFTIPDVPPGTYKIKMWHEGWKVAKKTPEGRFEFDGPKEAEKTVTVSAKGTATVDFELSE